MMNITWKRSGAILLLIGILTGTSTTFAQTWGYRSQNDQPSTRGDDRRQSSDRKDGGRQTERADQPRRDSRLSPDERRALRRQIDEAGRDIYTPRR